MLAVGLLFRLALLYRVPPLFMPGDSQSFLAPAYDLARGLPFDPILKRPLGYPLFLAGIIALFGEDPRSIVVVQAALGLATVAATYWIGRLAYGRAAGAMAALLVAIGGQLLIYEHYLLAESVFALLLALAVLALMAAARRGRYLAPAGGALLGLASLFRPIAEVLVPIVPVYFLLAAGPRRHALRLSIFAGLGLGLMLGPAFLADLALRGGASSGALGEHLLWRITRSDRGYIGRADVPPGEPDSPRAAAKRYVVQQAADRRLPQLIYTDVRQRYGLSAGEADGVLREVALEAIARQPVRYVSSTLRMAGDLFFAEDQRLGDISKRDGEARYSNPQSKQRDWFEDRILHLGEPPSQPVQNEFDRAEMLAGLYQPGRYLPLIALLVIVGTVLSATRRPNRLGLLIAFALPPMLLANAALAGPEARFRYPLDPLIGVLAAGGLTGTVALARKRLGARRGRPGAESRPADETGRSRDVSLAPTRQQGHRPLPLPTRR